MGFSAMLLYVDDLFRVSVTLILAFKKLYLKEIEVLVEVQKHVIFVYHHYCYL